MFKYRVLTFTIILSMLLFYVTPIGNINVKAEEVEYSQSQLQDVGAWFIGERLLEGAIENFDFSNLPTGVTAEDFLADLGAIIAEGNPDPLINDLGQAADDIWNGIEQELGSWSANDAWSLVKDFFYTMWYDVPSSPSLPPLANVFGIAADVLEASGVDKLLQFSNSPVPEPDEDYDFYIQYMNYLGQLNSNRGSGFFFYNYTGYNDLYTFPRGVSSSSWVSFPTQNFNTYFNSDSDTYYNITSYNPLTLYITKISDDNYTFNLNLTQQISLSDPGIDYYSANINRTRGDLYGSARSGSSYSFSSSGSLNVIFNYLIKYFKNVNIYVDNVPWAIVQAQNPIASTDLTYPNYEPAKYNYPEGTYIDWNRLYSIIYNAVRDGIVIDFGDLEDCFVDVNGQTAIATLGLVRNDYDNLVQEQFTMVPYPRFNDNLWLSNLADEMTEPAQNGVAIIENAYNIFPIPLQKALLFAGALLLFGLLIRRFLE